MDYSGKMSSELPDAQAVNNTKISSGNVSHSPVGSPIHNKFLTPVKPDTNPKLHRRNRTYSLSKREQELEEVFSGKVKEFCRNKGHGFIDIDGTGDSIFVHISDIEGEYVPKENDEVTFKILPLPYNDTKKQAVHVKIVHLAPGVSHETWSARSPTLSPRS